MNGPLDTSDRSVAELVERLGHAAVHASGFTRGLNPAQWSALRFFAQANRLSRTVGAFARYHGTTPGTASQTVKSLVQKGYLERTPLASDRRSARLELTESAREVLADDPLLHVARAAGSIDPGARSLVATALDAMLAVLESSGGAPTFRRCRRCRHLRALGKTADATHECALVGERIPVAELDARCVNFEPLVRGVAPA